MSTKSIGQLNYDVFCESSGRTPQWDNLSEIDHIAWNESAIVVRYAHQLMNQVPIVANVIEESVNGGGLGVEGGSTINQGGTG
jgi:hypothetical protein